MTNTALRQSFAPKAISNSDYVILDSLQVHRMLLQWVNEAVLPDLGIDAGVFWRGCGEIFYRHSTENRQLLEARDCLQEKIDAWHLARGEAGFDQRDYVNFLRDIGYIEPKVGELQLQTRNVDDEIARLAGPQLVVPLKNARFALNAVNARWGSLYDAFYGTDALPYLEDERDAHGFHLGRARRVVAAVRELLDAWFPLTAGSHAEIGRYAVDAGRLCMQLVNGTRVTLVDETQFRGYGRDQDVGVILLCHRGLHVELRINSQSDIGALDAAGVADVVLESALTCIMDGEDSVVAVSAEDKVQLYRHWLGLCRGNLSEWVDKRDGQGGGHSFERRMAEDREYCDAQGHRFTLPGRTLMFVRNVGHLMTTPALRNRDGEELPEGILDAIITSTIALYDLCKQGRFVNSRAGSLYIVKPKMHGSREVAFTCRVFDDIEALLGLPANTIKLGLMDEERRTSVNLKACIQQAAHRCVFINTGFLDRTGDEIHTSMHAGVMVPKTRMKTQAWLPAYEQWNVDIGLDCGFSGRGQIGKGMWAMPDRMHAMLQNKQMQLQAGASTAWVPSPTAATLHALHYHAVDVRAQQCALQQRLDRDDDSCFEALLSVPLVPDREALDPELIREELDNNCQSMLGYVVRWIDQGIGCSKVPDIYGVGLMEDRATLRISSQLLANWLLHGVLTREDVEAALLRMAKVVDAQNAADPNYQPLSDTPQNNIAFQATRALIFEGLAQPNGYTEPLLHHYRKMAL